MSEVYVGLMVLTPWKRTERLVEAFGCAECYRHQEFWTRPAGKFCSLCGTRLAMQRVPMKTFPNPAELLDEVRVLRVAAVNEPQEQAFWTPNMTALYQRFNMFPPSPVRAMVLSEMFSSVKPTEFMEAHREGIECLTDAAGGSPARTEGGRAP